MKEPIPKIELDESDMPNIKWLTPDELKLVPFEKKKLVCSVKDCPRFTGVKDYGISPEFYAFGQWNDFTKIIFFCPKHYKIFKAANRNNNIFEYKEGPALNHLT